MKRFYEPDLTSNPDSPFIREATASLCAALTGWTWMIGRLYGDEQRVLAHI
jgi:hypothetical protein